MKLIDWINRQPARVGFGQRGGFPTGSGTKAPTVFTSRAEVIATAIDDGYQIHLRTEGYGQAGDGGGALYVRAGSEPAHPGKLRSADGTWWEYAPSPEGTNVRAFGAVGDGTTDDSTAIANSWDYAITQRTQASGTPGGVVLNFPPGDYLITKNNIFGNPTYTGNLFWSNIKGAGRGSTILRFRPTTDNSEVGDNKYYLYDGGDGFTQNFTKLARTIVQEMVVYLEDTNLLVGDEIWIWRQDGTITQQNFRMQNVEVRGPGALADTGTAKSGVLDIEGSQNGSENYFTTCNFLYLSHILRSANPQGLDNVFIECDPWLIHNHFFVVDNASIEVRIYGGSWIWADTADVSPQYLLTVDSSGGSNPGVGNMHFKMQTAKVEMRNSGAALVSAEDASGAVLVAFRDVNFGGGSISGIRDAVKINANKVVTFDGCFVPDEFGYNFVAPNSNMGSLHWSRKTQGLITLTNCAVNDAISERITQTGGGGRVIANGCYELTETVAAVAAPVDFDSNPFNGGPNEPPARVKIGSGMPTIQTWSSGETYTFVLPYGARLRRVLCHRPPAGTDSVRTMTLSDGDGVLAAVSGLENAGFMIDYDSGPSGLLAPRTTTPGRRLSLSLDAAGAPVAGGLFLVEWI